MLNNFITYFWPVIVHSILSSSWRNYVPNVWIRMFVGLLSLLFLKPSNKWILFPLQANAYITIDLGMQYNVRAVRLWARPHPQGQFSKYSQIDIIIMLYIMTRRQSFFQSTIWTELTKNLGLEIVKWSEMLLFIITNSTPYIILYILYSRQILKV